MEGYRERERYTPGEMLRMIAAGHETRIARPTYQGHFADGTPNRYHGHKGFNWRWVRARLEERFTLETVRRSPLGVLPAGLNSQVWFTCVPR